MEISEWRNRIDELESMIIELLNKRASYAVEIGKIKKAKGLPVLDTAREQEILAYLAEGHSGAYISDVLFISPNTVRTHIHNIYRKLDVSSREDILRLTKG